MRRSSVCEECVRSYCSCSENCWNETLIFHPSCGEDRHSGIHSSSEAGHSPRELPVAQQIFPCPTRELDAVEGSHCLLHSRCWFCNGSTASGRSWKRSLKRKIVQVSMEEEVVDLPPIRKMLTQRRESSQWISSSVQESESDMNDEEISLQESSISKDCEGTAEDPSQGKDEVRKLKQALEAEHEAMKALYIELEEERQAAAVAATETMAMISRLQKEKAAVEMEARQFQRVVEEKSLYDQDAICVLKEILMRKEDERLCLEKEVQFYQQTLTGRAKGWGRENSHIQNAKGRELEAILLESKGIECNPSREHIPSGFERADASTRQSMAESFQLRPSAENRDNEELLLNSKDLDSEGIDTLHQTERNSAGFAYGNLGSNLLESFNSTMPVNRELGDVNLGNVDLPQLKQEIYREEDVGLDSMQITSRRSSSRNTIPLPPESNESMSPILVQEPTSRSNLDNLHIQAEEIPLAMARESTSENIRRASSESSQRNAGGKIHKPSGKLLRNLDQEHMDKKCKGSEGCVDELREIKRYVAAIPRVEDRDPTSDWNDCNYAPLHDVYEVHHDHHEDSLPTCVRSKGDATKEDESKFLERYGNTWQNATPPYSSQRSSRSPREQSPSIAMENSSSNNGIMDNPADMWCSDIGYPENAPMDLRMRDRPETPESRMRSRLGKPDQLLGSVDCDHQFVKGRHGSSGKRKQAAHLSERQNLRSQTADSALDTITGKCFFPSPDSPPIVSSHDVGEASLVMGNSSEIGVEDEVKQLTLRLHVLEADRESLKQTIESLRKGNDEMQMLESISQQLQELRRSEMDAKEVHESTFSSALKSILSFNGLRRSVLSQLSRLACLFLRGTHTGGELTEPVGLTRVLANERKQQATSCVTRELKAEVVGGLAILAGHTPRIARKSRHFTGWPTKIRGTLGTSSGG